MLRTEISDLDVKASKLDEDCEKKTGKIEELRKEEQQIKKLLTNHQKMIFACILEGALWAMSTVLEKLRKQEEVREMYKGDIAQ
jgi:hypoxanthine-guanine phosphoribosyltransferase